MLDEEVQVRCTGSTAFVLAETERFTEEVAVHNEDTDESDDGRAMMQLPRRVLGGRARKQ